MNIHKRFPSRLSILCLGAILCSCNAENYVTYSLVNSTSTSIKVGFSTWAFKDSMYITKDTTFLLPPNDRQTLSIRQINGGHVYNPEANSDTIWLFPSFHMYSRDTIAATTNLKKTLYWTYNNINRNNSTMTLTVLDRYFQ
jgi:hypothetical protein